MKILAYFLCIIGSYLLSWTLSYLLIMGLDFRFWSEYLWLVWIGNAGELPNYIRYISLALCIPILPTAFFLMKKYMKRMKANA